MSTVSDSTSYSNATQRLKDSYESERAQARANHEEQTAKLKEDYEEQLKSTKEDYQNDLSQEKAEAKKEVRRLKEELYSSKGKKVSQELKEREGERKLLSDYREQIEQDANRKVKKAEDRSDSQIEWNTKTESQRTEDALRAQKQSHVEEIKELQNELQTYRSEKRDTEAEKAKARQESISNYERDHLKEKSRIVDAYENSMDHLKDHQEESKNLFNRKLNDQSISAEEKARDRIRIQKEEFLQQQQELRADQRRMESGYQTQLANEKLKSAWNERRLIQQNDQQTESALNEKDRAYLHYLNEKNERIKYEVEQKDAKLQELQTTSDTLKVSPQLVKRIHDSEEKRYLAQLNQEKSVHQTDLAASRMRDHNEREDLREQYQKENRDLSRGIRRESDVQKRAFTESYQDLQDLHQQELALSQEKTQDVVAKLHSRHADEMAGEQRRTQDALIEQRDTLKIEKDHALDDLSQEKKAQSREWFMKVHDLRREYEGKLSQAQEEHEKQLSQLKYENDKKLREQDRTSKRFMDEKSRAFDHQIKQQELAFRERERFLTEHYESELDKMKLTNAHLISKKS